MANALAYDDTGAPGAPGDDASLPVVLIHGHPFDRSMWTPQLADLKGEFRVIAPDLRGYGGSPVVPGTTPFPAFAADIEALLDHLGVGDFVLGGLSMGGQLAMECAWHFGPRVRGLVLADTSPGAETPEGRDWRRGLAARLEREGMRGYAEEVLFQMVAPDAAPEVADHVLRMMTGTDPRGAAAALRGRAERPDYTELLGRIAVPSLVVVGSRDTFTPVDGARAMHAALPDAELCVIEGAAHLPNLERPGEFNAALRRLLSRV
ncbi:alpha/beta fold hydrolase [Streptomyces sp. NPDC002851]